MPKTTLPAPPRSMPRLAATLLASAALAACTSTPLPPWPTAAATAPAPAPATAPAPAEPAPAPAPPPAPDAVISTPVADSAAPDAPAQDSAAVAARFPDPPVRYRTPGLAPDRRAFTTNSELLQAFNELAAAPHGTTRTQWLDLGPSQRGNPLGALLLTRAAGTDLAALDASGRPTVLLIGQQHGDEPAASEALLAMARELAQGPLSPMLERIHVLIVPRANPDGADSGQHLTANGVDLDQDHLLLQTPEAQALARLVRDYRPTAILDLHEYPVGGPFLQAYQALQRHDVLLQHATTANMPEFIQRAALEWYQQPLAKALADAGLSHEWFYRIDPAASAPTLTMGDARAESARNVNGLKNAVSLMVAARGSNLGRESLQRRVHALVTAATSVLRSTVTYAGKLAQVRAFVAQDTAAQACRGSAAADAGLTPTERQLTMLDPATGADLTRPVAWESALQLRPLQPRPRPCGYWLSANAGDAAQRLQWLGLQVQRVAEPGGVLVDLAQGGSAAPQRTTIDVPAQSYYIPLNQPLAPLAMAALEPDSPSGYLTRGLILQRDDSARVMAPPALVFEDDGGVER